MSTNCYDLLEVLEKIPKLSIQDDNTITYLAQIIIRLRVNPDLEYVFEQQYEKPIYESSLLEEEEQTSSQEQQEEDWSNLEFGDEEDYGVEFMSSEIKSVEPHISEEEELEFPRKRYKTSPKLIVQPLIWKYFKPASKRGIELTNVEKVSETICHLINDIYRANPINVELVLIYTLDNNIPKSQQVEYVKQFLKDQFQLTINQVGIVWRIESIHDNEVELITSFQFSMPGELEYVLEDCSQCSNRQDPITLDEYDEKDGCVPEDLIQFHYQESGSQRTDCLSKTALNEYWKDQSNFAYAQCRFDRNNNVIPNSCMRIYQIPAEIRYWINERTRNEILNHPNINSWDMRQVRSNLPVGTMYDQLDKRALFTAVPKAQK